MPELTPAEELRQAAAQRGHGRDLSCCIPVNGTVTISGDILICFRCAASGPWLLFAVSGDAFATCVCGCRNVHMGLTGTVVEALVSGAEAVWPSVDDAERGLGFGGTEAVS